MSAAFEPAPVRPRRRFDLGRFGLLVVALLVGLAWLKPWAAPEPGDARPSQSPSTRGAAVQPVASAALAAGAGPSSAPASAGPLTDAQRRAALVDRIVGWLAPAAGSWGVGSGGWTGTPGDGRDVEAPGTSAWSFWNAAYPEGTPPPLAKAARACGKSVPASSPTLVPAGAYVIAVTVPMGVTPDWRVAAVRRTAARTEDLAPVLRQVSPPGNRGIAYLFRSDDLPWPGGLYRFRILGPLHPVAIDACVTAAT